jgi:hypothetical protein
MPSLSSAVKSAIPLHKTCRQATHLMLEQQDRPLKMYDHLALKIHLWICTNCPQFHRQLEVMQRALSDWRNEIKK